MRVTSALPVALTVALAAAACGGGTVGGPDVGTPLGSWQLREAAPPIEFPAPARVTLTIDEDDQGLRAGGTAACNSYGGRLQLDGQAWSLQQVAVTEMGCEQPLMAAEAAYLDALARIETWQQPTPDVLELTGGDVTLVLDLLPAVETAALTGTTWVLDGLLSGTGESAAVRSPTAGVEPAELRLDEDGTFRLFTGCRDFAGDWVDAGEGITFPSWGQTADSRGVGPDGDLTCSGDAEAQERDVLGVLEGTFVATVDGPRLTIQQGESGLSMRAGDDAGTG